MGKERVEWKVGGREGGSGEERNMRERSHSRKEREEEYTVISIFLNSKCFSRCLGHTYYL